MIRHLQSSILTLEEKNMISSPMRFIINFNFFVSLSHTENSKNGRYYQEDNFWAACTNDWQVLVYKKNWRMDILV